MLLDASNYSLFGLISAESVGSRFAIRNDKDRSHIFIIAQTEVVMKNILLFSALLLSVIALVGCDHSTNNQAPPAGTEVLIVNPTNDTVVDGTVAVSVDASSIDKVTKVELYINGQLSQACTAPPWQFSWTTTNLPSNSFHTLYTKAYALGSGYSVSQAVTVRKR